MYHWLRSIDSLPNRAFFFLIPLLVGIVAAGDYATGYEAAFAIFYLLPVSITTYVFGKRAGLALSVICAAIWGYINQLAGETFSHPFILYWNECTRFGFFAFTTVLLSDFQSALKHQQSLALTDPLSGLLNRRAFYEEIERELPRCGRYKRPFTIAYIDLDKFKAVNDVFGHHAGDEVITIISHTLREQTRQLDAVARLGGDEFALLMPETNLSQAEIIMMRIKAAIIQKMQEREWPVTPSIGVITIETPQEVDAIIKAADELMYKVKRRGGNDILHDTIA